MRSRTRRAAAERSEPGARATAATTTGTDAGRALTLADLCPGECARIVAVGGPGEIRERLRDLGFVEGEPVRMIKTAPLADPSEYCVQGVDVGLRRREAQYVEVRDATDGDGRCRQRRGQRAPCEPRARGSGDDP